MIRSTMLALSLFGLSATAFAAPVVKHHSTKMVAQAPAADGAKAAAPAGEKKAKHTKKAKGETKAEAPKADAPKADAPATK